MSRDNIDHQFVDTDPEIIEASLILLYQEMTGMSVNPASPERLFIAWLTDACVQILALVNHAANQNLLSRAVDENLDALGEMLYPGITRPQAQPAVTTMEFTISDVQASSLLIPKGTRVAVENSALVFETTEDVYVTIGNLSVDAPAVCQTAGIVGNGYTAGQIAEAVDVFPYFLSCRNITMSDGGADIATDDEYYDLMVSSRDAFTTAGAIGSYKYWVASASIEIADVVVNSPAPGEVGIYVLMDDGTMASAEVKDLVAAACNADSVRPLTDLVTVRDPDVVPYDITMTYYIDSAASQSGVEIASGVDAAVAAYQVWQATKLGRDINPSKLVSMLMGVPGVKRVVVSDPGYAVLSDGTGNATPELAQAGTVTVTNGGYENE